MAERKTRKVSRRQVMTVLPASAVAALFERDASAQPDKCAAPATTIIIDDTRDTSKKMKFLISDSCCPATKRAILSGVKSNPGDGAHMKPIVDQLNSQYVVLEEYCVMLWGIHTNQLKSIHDFAVKSIQTQIKGEGK